VLFVVDVSVPPTPEDRRVSELLQESRTGSPVVLACNKIDRARPDQLIASTDAYRLLAPEADWTTLSATKGDGVEDLIARLIAKLPAGPQFFPADQLSETSLRDIAAEIVREKALLNTEQEVPHAVAVEVEEFKERSSTLTYIGANIYVERE